MSLSNQYIYGNIAGFYDPLTGKPVYNMADNISQQYNANDIDIIIDGKKKDVERARKILDDYGKDSIPSKTEQNLDVMVYNPMGMGYMFGVPANVSTNFTENGMHVVLTGSYKHVKRAKTILAAGIGFATEYVSDEERDKRLGKRYMNEAGNNTEFKYERDDFGPVLVDIKTGARIVASTLILFEKNSSDADNPYVILVKKPGKYNDLYRDTGELLDTTKPPNAQTCILSANEQLQKQTCGLFNSNATSLQYEDVSMKDGLICRCFYVCLEPINHNLNYMFKTNKLLGQEKTESLDVARFSIKDINSNKKVHPIVIKWLDAIGDKIKMAVSLPKAFNESSELGTMMANSYGRRNIAYTVAGKYSISFS